MQGAGLGLRRPLLKQILAAPSGAFDFLEVAPENWIGFGGARARSFADLAERYPVVLHGLSLNLGGSAPLNEGLINRIGAFMRRHACPIYSEHLTACGDRGQLYDLMPIPFTGEAVHHVAARIRRVQELLDCRIAVENASYYAAPGKQMKEIDFLCAVLEEADCDLLLDVNNVRVNSINHGYDALEFLKGIPAQRVLYLHTAGHYHEAPDLRIDTHGAAVPEEVWQLLEHAYRIVGVKPTLLERDFNFPPFARLLEELEQIREIQGRVREETGAAVC